MAAILVWIINLLFNLLVLLLFVYVITSYFLSPFHPIREWLGKLFRPMLDPLRSVIPPIAGLDLSPILLYLIFSLLSKLLRNVAVLF